MVEQATQALGPIDILVNSAAVFDDKLFLESGPEDWRRMIEVCLYGAMNVIHAVLPGMVERRHGRIIALASDAARIGQARLSYYAAATGRVVALVKPVAQECGRAGVTPNVRPPCATQPPPPPQRTAGR